MQIIQAETKKQKTEFINFPATLYQHSPQWCPLFLHEHKNMVFHNRSIVFDRSKTIFFLAEKDGKTVGRICVGVDEILNRHKRQQHAFFTLFDCIQDSEVAQALLTKACEWSKNQGMVYLKGGVSPTNGDDFRGILTEGFEYPSYFLMPYNYEYYKDFFTAWERYLDYYGFSYELDNKSHPIKLELMKRILLQNLEDEKVAKITDETELTEAFLQGFFYKEGYSLTELDLKKTRKSAGELLQILTKSIPEDWEEDLLPFEYAQCEQLVKNFSLVIPRQLALIVHHQEKPIAVAAIIPNYNQVVRQLKGKLFPFGWIRILNSKYKLKEARAVILFVIPEYQNRGLSALLILKLKKTLQESGFQHIEFSSISAYNQQMVRLAEFIGCKRYKTYTVFGKNLLDRALTLEEVYGTAVKTMSKFKKKPSTRTAV